MWQPNITRIIGGPFACPPIPPDVSDDNNAGDTFRITNKHDTAVANPNVIHATILNGIVDNTTAGMYGTNEYPYKQIHSTNCNAFIDIQHCVVIHNIVGKINVKLRRIDAACNKWLIS